MYDLPENAADIIHALPKLIKKDMLEEDALHRFHFLLEGPTGGNFTVTVKDKKAVVLDGLVDEATCEVTAKAEDFEDIVHKRGNPAMMFMMGKIKVSNIGEIMKFVSYLNMIKP